MTNENNVFIVDNDRSARKGFARLLRVAGYDVKEFTTVMEFQDFFESDTSGCVLMDIKMPGISGKEMVTLLKNHSRNLSVIIVSTNDNQEARKLAKDMGAIGFFRKPVDGTALLDSIMWVLKSDSTRNNHNNN